MDMRLGTHFAALVIGLGLGIGAVAAASQSPQPATAHMSAADTRIVTELRKLNQSVTVLNKSLTGYEASAPSKSISRQLSQICQNTGAIDGAYNNATC